MSKKKNKKNTAADTPVTELSKPKKPLDYVLWGWVILLIIAGLFMGYRFIHG